MIDQAVVDFSAGLIDIIMMLGFGEGPSGARWQQCGVELNKLAKALESSTAPAWVIVPRCDPLGSMDDSLITMEGDSDEEDGPASFVPFEDRSIHAVTTSTSASASTSLPAPSSSTSTARATPPPPATDFAVVPYHSNQVVDPVARMEIDRLTLELRRVRRTVKTLYQSMWHLCLIIPCQPCR